MISETVIPLSVPNLKGNELKYVTNAVETEWVSTAGPYVEEFEKKTAEYLHTEAATSCQNGTAGLHIALMMCNVTRDDMVIVPTLTFIAAVNPVAYIGAEPLFMDCDDSLCMDPVKLLRFCEEECEIQEDKLIYKASGKCIKAVVVVHVFGNMADMERILQIAEKYHLKVVEDATEAIGTYYTSGKYAGKYAGTMGDIGVYSFNGNKIITTGGGGMIVARDQKVLQHAKHLTTQAKADTLNFIHDEIGYNYRMTNLQAALGLAQLEQLEKFIQTKKENYERYRSAIDQIPGLKMLNFKDGVRANYWFYSVFCKEDYPMKRDELIRYLSEHHVQSRPIWGLISEQKPYAGAKTYQIEKAQYYQQSVVNIPCSTNLRAEDIDRIIELLHSII